MAGEKKAARKNVTHAFRRGILPIVSVVVVCCIVAMVLVIGIGSDPRKPDPLPDGEADAPGLIGAPASAQPISARLPPDNPYMGIQGVNSMHADTYNSDAQAQPGPLGHAPDVTTRRKGGLLPGSCPITTVTKSGELVVLCGALFHFEFELLDPDTLDLLATYKLPTRPSSYHTLFTLNPDYIMADTSGAYFYLDHQGRIVYADAKQHIQRIAIRHEKNGDWQFERVNDWNLSGDLPHDCWGLFHWLPSGTCDPITAVMPDYQGRIWWVSLHGRIGILNPENGHASMIHLKGEQIQNGFAADRHGVYVVSDHAMYGLRANAGGSPEVVWREAYDRGNHRKVGSINQGSGTTPTLLGKRYVGITDNADPRLHLLVYRRQAQVHGKRLVCSMPLFKPGASATDNAMVGFGNTLIVENNHGYTSAFEQEDWNGVTGGIWRVDVLPDGSGCKVVWKSSEKAPSVVPKLSMATGLVYYYTFKQLKSGENAWYLMALDFATGATRFKILTGVGSPYDNNWSPITLGPEGTAYVGTYKGMVAIRDGS